jgi:hypothetical protein
VVGDNVQFLTPPTHSLLHSCPLRALPLPRASLALSFFFKQEPNAEVAKPGTVVFKKGKRPATGAAGGGSKGGGGGRNFRRKTSGDDDE